MKRWVMVVSDKGGTGKSIFSRGLADRLRRSKTAALLVDGDGTVGQLLQFYGERDRDDRLCRPQAADTGVMTFDMKGGIEDRDALINCMEYAQEVVLCDLPAGSISFLESLDKEMGLLDMLSEAGYRVTLVNVISPYRASTRTVQKMIEFAGARADYLVVFNAWYGTAQDYVLWYGNDHIPASKGIEWLERHQGRLLTMPRLEGRTGALIDAFNLSYSQAREDPRLTIADRARVHRWLKVMDSELDKSADLLGIPTQQALHRPLEEPAEAAS